MPKANVFNMAGQQVGEIELSEAVFGIEPNEDVVHAVVKLLLQPMQLLAHGAQLGNRVAGEIQQRPGRLAFGQMLPKHPEPVVLRQRNRSPVGLDIPGDDAEKRTFAGSVRTDHADPVAGIDPECDSVQNRISGIILDYIFKIDHFFSIAVFGSSIT